MAHSFHRRFPVLRLRQFPNHLFTVCFSVDLSVTEDQFPSLHSNAHEFMRQTLRVLADSDRHNIIKQRPNKTCIVTTHRPSVLNLCQRVYRVVDTKITLLSEEESSQMAIDF